MHLNPSVLAELLAAAPDLTDTFGLNPVRIFPYGEIDFKAPAPYAIWTVVPGAGPYTSLSDSPGVDQFIIQFDVYGGPNDADVVDGAAKKLVEALAAARKVVLGWNHFDRDKDTGQYRMGFDVSWHRYR